MTTFDRIKRIFVTHLDCEPHEVTPEALMLEDLGADSLDNVELIMACEEEFDCEILDADAERCRTVGDVLQLVERLVAAKAVAA